MFKKTAILGLSMLTMAFMPLAYAADDLKDVRIERNKAEWQLVKHDITRNIKTYIRERW